MEQTIKTDETPAAPTVANDAQNNALGLKVAIVIVATAAVCGIGFGIFGMTQSAAKDEQISDLEAQLADLPDNSEDSHPTPDTSQDATSNIVPTPANGVNPVISAKAPEFYSLGFNSAIIAYGEDGQFSMSLNVRDGEITGCSVQSVTTRWVGGNDGGIVRDTRHLKDCEVKGVTGKIYKVVEIGEGHDASADSVAFILEDGTVDYLCLNCALQKSDFNVKGKLKISGSVVDAITIGVSEEGKIGGAGSTIFVLADGSYVRYSKAMVEEH